MFFKYLATARAFVWYISSLGCKHLPTWSRLGLHPEKMPRKMPPMLEWQPPRTKVSRQMFHYDKSFKLICHMPIFQVIYKSSKNQVDSKEDIEKTSPNAGTAASMIKRYQLKHSACKELSFDILHAYLASNMRLFQESGSSKKKTLKKPLPMLEWQADLSKSSL